MVDSGHSRASWIPISHNQAGFPEGISGTELLERMCEQARRYGARLEQGRVTGWSGTATCSRRSGDRAKCARAPSCWRTGVTNRRPDMGEAEHDEALGRGLIRYWPDLRRL